MNNTSIHAVAAETSRVESFDWVVITSLVLLVCRVNRQSFVPGLLLYIAKAVQALTIIGALGILGSMAWLEYRGRPATTRTRLVQALVLSDLVLGYVHIFYLASILASLNDLMLMIESLDLLGMFSRSLLDTG